MKTTTTTTAPTMAATTAALTALGNCPKGGTVANTSSFSLSAKGELQAGSGVSARTAATQAQLHGLAPDGGATGAKSLAALADQDAGLIGTFHDVAPKSKRRKSASVYRVSTIGSQRNAFGRPRG